MNNTLNLLNQWDPIDLLPYAPSDEYIVEAKKIDDFILQNPNITTEELASEINEIFRNSFGEDVYKEDYNACYSVAVALLK